LTAKFVGAAVKSMQHYNSEQHDLVNDFNVEILRLKNFSRIFSDVDGIEVDMKLLESVENVCSPPSHSKQILILVTFSNSSKLLSRYSSRSKKYWRSTPHLQPVWNRHTRNIRRPVLISTSICPRLWFALMTTLPWEIWKKKEPSTGARAR